MFKPKKTENMPAEIQPRAVDTIIGEQCAIHGDLSSPQSVKIDGKIEGNVIAKGCVIIGEKAVIKGDIESQELVMYGQLNGNIRAKTVQLKNSAKILGSIATESLQIEPGAVYQGNVEMQTQVLGTDKPETLEIKKAFSLSDAKTSGKKTSTEKTEP
ncbi:MAG: polymer-forming cytoskeletal protein [Neisseria sp.]|nr:polymer-forming cytoskeletal protein [Neisseria sp.]